MPMNRTQIEAELATIADELEHLEPLYARRLELWLEGRDLGMTQRELSIPARVTEGAVTQALRKHRLRVSA